MKINKHTKNKNKLKKIKRRCDLHEGQGTASLCDPFRVTLAQAGRGARGGLSSYLPFVLSSYETEFLTEKPFYPKLYSFFCPALPLLTSR